MTPGQALAAGVIIVGFFVTIYGLVVAISRVANHWAYRYEQRHQSHRSDLVERVGEYGEPATIHPLQFYRARRDRAPRPRRPAA